VGCTLVSPVEETTIKSLGVTDYPCHLGACTCHPLKNPREGF
jgi:hypothetical protein